MVLKSFQSFGFVDAESDQGLPRFFLETPAYLSIENQRRMVVTGRKGAGKTAIYTTLRDRAHRRWKDVFAAGVDFSGYPWDLHDAACSSQAPSAERYAVLWQFLILMEFAKLVLREQPHAPSRKTRRARGRVERFIKRNWGGYGLDVHQTFARPSYTLTVEPKAFGFSLGALQREKKVARSELAMSLPSVNLWLRENLKQMLAATPAATPETHYFVLFDDLDGGYSAENEMAKQRLIGLLVAARGLHLWAKWGGIPFMPVVFMRSDIYAALHFPDKNKIAAELLEQIAWSESETADASLKRLINERIEGSIGYPTSDAWGEVFADEQIERRPLYEFMASRTHLRPRDMIRLANVCLARAKEAGATYIEAAHVLAAMPAYSEYLLGEIGDEARQSDVDWDACLMTLGRVGVTRFDRDTFVRMHGQGSEAAGRMLRALYDLGVVGYTRREGVVFSYRSDTQLDLDAPAFEIHPGLWDALQLASRSAGDGRDPA